MFQPAMPLKMQDVLDIACSLHDGAWAIVDNTYNKSNHDMQHPSMKQTRRLYTSVLFTTSSSFATEWITGKQQRLSIPVSPIANIRKERVNKPGK